MSAECKPVDALNILQHALGLNEFGEGRAYRAHFVTDARTTDHPVCMDLVKQGLMSKHAPSALSGGADVFMVTPAGREYVARNSPKRPALTRSQKRYERFLDEDCGMRFGEWLKAGGGRA